MKRWVWNQAEVQEAVIYCPWLIHNKCVEPRRAGRGESNDGVWGCCREGTQTVGALSRPAGSLSADTSPPAPRPDRFISTTAHTHNDTRLHPKHQTDFAAILLLFS